MWCDKIKFDRDIQQG